MTMLARLVFGAMLVAIVSPAFAIDPLPFKDRAEELRFQDLTRELRCLVCQNENLADSHAPLAKDLRQQVFEQMQAGKSDAQIKEWLTDRYSDFVLYDPPLRSGTLLLWFGPFVVLLIGAVVIGLIVRRRSRGLAHGTQPKPAINYEDWS
ncbi:MAG: cytochrome c-type biogenesis protein [Dokdonella sp.]